MGFNTLGFRSDYIGRIASFTGDELKIGGFYYGFLFICLLSFSKKKIFIPLLIIFLLIALVIGERSNFLKIIIMYFTYFMFFTNISFLKKLTFIIVFFLITFFIANNSPNMKAKYNFVDILNLKQNIENIKDENFFNSMINSNRYFVHYKIAVNIFKQNIILGSGFKTYRIESYNSNNFDETLEFSVGYGATHPHQLHFEILSELGLLGYFLIILNLLYLLLRQINLKKENITKSAILFLIATLVPLLPSGSFFTSFTATIFFINYSFLIKTDNISNKKKIY